MMRSFSNLSILALGLAACTAPGIAGFTSYDAPPDPADTTAADDPPPGVTTIEPVPTTSAGEGPASTTGDPSSTGEGESGAVEPVEPPTIVEHALGPNPLELPGPIATMIATANADGVRMQLDDAEPVELDLAEPDNFAGEIALIAAEKNNGDHVATFVAWRDALESAPTVVPFTVALPAAGNEIYWDSDDAIGPGAVVALAVTPNAELIELGTFYPMGQPRCYLRRRTLGGAWGPDDFLNVMPDTMCGATGLAVDAMGALFILANRAINGAPRWWLGKIDTWAAPPITIGTGTPEETAHALASDPTRVAVCGTQPAGDTANATAWIFAPGLPGNILSFDYVPEGKDKDNIRETPRDCAFSDKHLVLAGNAWGPHDIDNIARDRHFILEIDVAAAHPTWTVANAKAAPHSQAHTLTINAQGHYITGGQRCDEACNNPIAEFRMFLPGSGQIWHHDIAPGATPPRDMAWSPADYFVFVSSMAQGPNDTAFLTQAWVPHEGIPTWSYGRHDAPALQSADALAIGPYGQVYAGGVSADGFPAIAIIAP